MFARSISFGLLLAMLAACGGGGGGAGGGVPQGPGSASSGAATVSFTIGGSGSTIQNALRRPSYISSNTASIAISVNSAPVQTFACPASTCTATFSVPAGNDTFAIVDTDAQGNALARATFQQACASGATTAIRAVLDGVVATADIDLSAHYAAMGAPSVTRVIVTARDASGAVIVGPGNFTQAVPLTNSDTSGAMVLSKTSVSSPADAVTLTYDGSGYANAVISSTVPTLTGVSKARLIPLLPATETPLPSGAQTGTGMARGSDGALWFSEARAMGRVTPGGAISEYPVAAAQWGPGDIALGADNNIWYAGANNNDPSSPARAGDLGAITPAGVLTTYTAPSNGPVSGMALGADGNMWYGRGSTLGRITPAGLITELTPMNGSAGIGVTDLVTGPDGNLWIAYIYGEIYRYVIATGAVSAYSTPPVFPGAPVGSMQPYRIVVGPDANLYINSLEQVAKVDTSGNILATYPFHNVFGSNGQMASALGAVWVPLGINSDGHPLIARVTPGGQYAELALPAVAAVSDPNAIPGAIALGADGAIWYLRSHYVGRFPAH